MSAEFSLSKKVLTGVACSVALLVSGCAFSGSGVVSTSGNGASPLIKGNMGGVARGGRQGIYGASVTLYGMSVNTTAYGDTPTVFAVTTTVDSNGDFSFTKGADGTVTANSTTPNTTSTWSCPSNAAASAAGTTQDPYLYLVATGGDTSGTGTLGSHYNNTYAKLMTVIGDCNSVTQGSLYTINEATTVASMVALQQFFNPMTQAIGAPGVAPAILPNSAPYPNTVGLTNAVKMISNLVDISTGEFRTAVTYTANSSSSANGVTITVSPEGAKLSTMANILAACISSNPNVSATNCNALATNAVPPTTAPPAATGGQITTTESSTITNFPTIVTYPTVTDTLQAIDYMLINPTESQDYAAGSGKLYNLFSLSFTGTQPFGGAGSTSAAPLASSAQPMDWTVGINFTASGACSNIVTGSGGNVYPTGIAQPFLNNTYGLAVDKNGNIWMGGSVGTYKPSGGVTGPTGQGDTLVEVSPTGAPLQCLAPGVPATYTTGITNGRVVTLDSKGNVWWATDQGLFEVIQDTTNSSYTASPLTVLNWNQPGQSGTTIDFKASAVGADIGGNIFVAPDAAPVSATSTIYEYQAAATQTTANAVTPFALGGAVLATSHAPYRNMTVDKNDNLGVVGTTSTRGTYAFQPSSSGTNGYVGAAAVLPTNCASTLYGLSLDNKGNSIGGNTISAGAGKLYRFNAASGLFVDSGGSSGTTACASQTVGLNIGGQNADRSTAVDGANNIWTGGGPYANDATGTLNSVGESDSAYNSISPVGMPYQTTGCVNPCPVYGAYTKPFFYSAFTPLGGTSANSNMWGLAIDSSGNVWGAESNANLSTFFTIVGQAVPVPTPVVNNPH